MLLRIEKYGAESLRKVSAPVESFDRELERIARDMVETMYGAPGIGLIKICNPEIVASEGEQKSEEGCLSIPEFTDTITRPRKLVVKGLDLHGNEIRFEAEGLLARCFSHEIDHLNGMLFVDRLSALKRNLILNKIRKMAKAGEW